jgi:superfamily II DNA/RNA helicase
MFAEAPFLLLSATMMPYIWRFIHLSLHLNPRVSFVQRSIDRSNVFIGVERISTKTSDHRQLYFLVPSNMQHPAQIAQTVVFIDSRPDAKRVCDEFWKLIPPEWKDQREFKYIFAECSTISTPKRHWVIMNAFKQGLCRILFATEVAGMGIDFPSVERVIQWRVGPNLSISGILQCLGRASRRSGTQGVFLLFYTHPYRLVENSDQTLSIYRTDAASDQQSRIEACIAGVNAWTNGTERVVPAIDPLDAPVIPYDVDNATGFDSSVATSRAQGSHPTESWIDQELSKSGSDTSDSDLTFSEAEGDPDSSDAESISSVEATLKEKQAGRRKGLQRYLSCCRGVTWLINTRGCRRIVLLKLFDNTGLQPTSYRLSNHQPQCCDIHLQEYLFAHPDINPSDLPISVQAIQHLLPPTIQPPSQRVRTTPPDKTEVHRIASR